jgi:hypothetical protein
MDKITHQIGNLTGSKRKTDRLGRGRNKPTKWITWNGKLMWDIYTSRRTKIHKNSKNYKLY